jgi:uncharacterized protein YjbJ (UPF0337 family)
MDKETVKGAVNDAAGRAKRQVGEWTGDTDAQVEGTLQQAKGKAQKAVGNIKDAARDAKDEMDKNNAAANAEQRDRERRDHEQHHGA